MNPLVFRNSNRRCLIPSPQVKTLPFPDIVSPHTSPISSLSLSNINGRYLLAGSSDSTISYYDLRGDIISRYLQETIETERALHQLATGEVVSIAEQERRDRELVPIDDHHLLCKYKNRSALSPPAGEASPNSLPGHHYSISSVMFYRDPAVFFSADRSGLFLVWDVANFTPGEREFGACSQLIMSVLDRP